MANRARSLTLGSAVATAALAVLLLAPPAPLRAAEAAPGDDRGLVGCWRFDEGQGQAAKDSSTYGNDGTITGAKWASGVLGGALAFNGVNEFATVRSPGPGVIGKAVSVEAWIQSTGNNTNANLVFAGHESLGYGIWVQGGRFFAGVWNTTGTQYSAVSASGPTPGRWYHVAMTCDFEADKVVRLYIDGRLDCTSTATGDAIQSGQATIDIGGRTPNSWYFHGLIDEVKLHNRALSAEELRRPCDDYMKRKAEGLDTACYRNSPWIWSATPADRTVMFRKSFKAPAVAGQKVFLVCDGDRYQVHLNGKALIPLKEYSEAQIVDVTRELITGWNVIAAEATNRGGNTGFFAYIGYPRRESPGGYDLLVSGDGMKCSAQPAPNWYGPGFDDSKWATSQRVSDFGKSLALKRNFPDLGLYLSERHGLTPPDLAGGTALQCASNGLTLVLTYSGKKHTFLVKDSVTHETWFMPGPPFMIDEQVSAWEGSVSCERLDNGFRVTASDFAQYPGLKVAYTLVLRNRALEVTLEPIQFPADKKALSLSFPLDFGAARAGEDGYLVNSYGEYGAREGRIVPFGVDVDRYADSGGLAIRAESSMPFFGIVRRGHPCAAIVTDFPAADYQFRTLAGQNGDGGKRLCATTPIWTFEQDRANEPRHIAYHFLERGGYVEVAKAYRQFLMDTGRYVTLRERVKQRPVCGRSVNASFFWGAYALPELPGFMAKLKENGIGQAVLQVANRNDFVGGWRRWPEGMTPVSSTTEEFRHAAAAAREYGYGFSPVDEYTPFADRGKDYDASLRAMRRDGGYYAFETEKCFFLCESQKLRFATRDLPRVKEVIGECPYLLDCEGCTVYDCFDPRHPMTFRQQMLARREYLTYVRNTMGSLVSEGSPSDWLTDIIDVGHGHSIGFEYWGSKPGQFIPLWSLVYGGSVIDLFRVPGAEDGMLYAALYGLNARFDEYNVGKTQSDWHKRVSDAWPERNYYELVDHQFITPLVQRSQFRDGGRRVDVIANFGDADYLYGRLVVPRHDFQVVVGGSAVHP